MTDLSGEAPSLSALRERLTADLRVAMKARETLHVSTIRSLLAALDNAGAVSRPSTMSQEPVVGRPADVARKDLSPADVQSILAREAGERSAAAAEYQRLNRPADADRMRMELEIIGTYLR